MFPIFAGNSASTGYNLTRSLRTRASASAYLNRTPSVAGNRKTFTWSGWVKRGSVYSATTDFCLFSAYGSNDNSGYWDLRFSGGATLNVGVWVNDQRVTSSYYRDPSAWYHVVCAVDTTQATASNRTKLYVNGVQLTAFSTQNDLAQNTDTAVNNTVVHNIGASPYTGRFYFDGYLSEVNFIDGQALTPSSFGSTNALTGVWQPARYAGTYGTNGFYLPFTDNSALTTSSNVGLGKDFSGNGNYWVTNNISITAGVTYDSMTDVPTLTSATAANYCVMNPLNLYAVSVGVGTLTNGNLRAESNAGVNANNAFPSTIAVSSGKWYYEATILQTRGVSNSIPTAVIGFYEVNTSSTAYSSNNVAFVAYISPTNSAIRKNGVDSGTLTSVVANDVIGVALDLTNLTCDFYLNGSAIGSQVTGLTAANYNAMIIPVTGLTQTTIAAANFGQRPFAYTPPTGFVALNTYNLPTNTIVKGNTVMDATLYTGTGASLSVTNTASFKPDLVWVKSRSAATDNKLTDSVRGVTKGLVSNTLSAETTDTQGLTTFGSAGFTVGTDTTYNNLSATYVGWQWQAGQGSTSSNTNGTITSTVSVNASAGFSIVTYTGTGANATVGHGLGVAPSFIITKSRTNSSAFPNWNTYHSSLGAGSVIYLANTSAAISVAGMWNNTSPTSSVFSVGTDIYGANISAAPYVAYCWTPIAGFSAFGSYTGNGSTDGPFVYTGFLPRWVLVKRTDTAGTNWDLYDTARNTYNAMDLELFPNSSSAEYNGSRYFDFLSNGFKPRTSVTDSNASGGTYIYAAFATNPFKNSLAR